jgi:hypothetical protein
MWPDSGDEFTDDEFDKKESSTPDLGMPSVNETETGTEAAFVGDDSASTDLDEVHFPPLIVESDEEITGTLTDSPTDSPTDSRADDSLEESYVTDAAYSAGNSSEADEYFSIDSLPKTSEEAFATVESEDESSGGSVFITSDEEVVDETYVPISLKSEEQDELFHDLDDFPEPGELSTLNYEDTMEINAMLEEANISKEQIESALSAAEVDKDAGEGEGELEEISLSSGGGNDFTESLFADIDDPDSLESTDAAKPMAKNKANIKSKENAVVSFFKNLMPIGLGKKKAWQEPVIADDQTQLIKSLSRSRERPVAPLWVSKYLPIAAVTLLSITLFGQLGYFYMDKLVHISSLRPVLELGCKIASCRLPAVQNIDQVEQLSSRLDPVSGQEGGFSVTSILVNRDIRSQSFPALELTLTDRSGNMISRRIISRDQYLADAKKSLMLPNEATEAAIYFKTPSIRVTGFELRAVSQNWLERSE